MLLSQMPMENPAIRRTGQWLSVVLIGAILGTDFPVMADDTNDPRFSDYEVEDYDITQATTEAEQLLNYQEVSARRRQRYRSRSRSRARSKTYRQDLRKNSIPEDADEDLGPFDPNNMFGNRKKTSTPSEGVNRARRLLGHTDDISKVHKGLALKNKAEGSDKDPIWIPFMTLLEKWQPELDCKPIWYNVYRPGYTCHSERRAIDVSLIRCDNRYIGAFDADFKDLIDFANNNGMCALFHDGGDKTNGHRDHGHFSKDCQIRGC